MILNQLVYEGCWIISVASYQLWGLGDGDFLILSLFTILDWQLFSFSSLKMLFHYFLASIVICQSYYCSFEGIMFFSSLAAVKIFLIFFKSSFTMIFAKVVFFVILLEFSRNFEYVAWLSSVSLIKLLTIISLNILFLSFVHFSVLDSSCNCVTEFPAFHMSFMLCSLLLVL